MRRLVTFIGDVCAFLVMLVLGLIVDFRDEVWPAPDEQE